MPRFSILLLPEISRAPCGLFTIEVYSVMYILILHRYRAKADHEYRDTGNYL